MSLFGKILALCNILGAAAFLVIGFMDYAKRETWAYANYVHDVALTGMPLDDKQLDDRESPLKYNLATETKKQWFGSDPVSTQVEEVNRVKKQVDDLLAKTKDDPTKQTVELARILTPFAQHYAEREWLLSIRNGLATADTEAQLHKRLHDAFTPAVAACLARPGGLKFPQAFVEACRAQSADLAPAFEQTFLKILPAKPENSFDDAMKKAAAGQDAHDQAEKFLQALRDDPAATVRKTGDDPADSLDKVYQDTLTALHEQLKAQLDDLTDRAQNGPKPQDTTKTDRLRDYQHVAVAHYLFNLVEVLDPEAADKGVVAAPAYGRFLRVVGLTQGTQEINDQALVLKNLAEELQVEREQERGDFATAHRKLIDELQGQAVRLHNADDLLTGTKILLDKQTDTTKTQQAKVTAAEAELKDARAKTAAAMAELRKTSDLLHDMRIQSRDLLGENIELEQKIRDLEKKR